MKLLVSNSGLLKSVRSLMLGLSMAVACVSAISTSAYAVSATDADGRSVALNAPGKISVVLYLNGDLEDESRKVSQGLDGYIGRGDFQCVRVVDLRGDVPPVARQSVQKETLKQLDREATRLTSVYKKHGFSGSPRQDLSTILDFQGSTLKALGWNQKASSVMAIIYNKKGDEVKRLDSVTSAGQITSAIKGL
ncbi:MAG: hypothetical protein ACAI35_16755 [Candidatus Methylacidiphilales bacterium]|nr:hypothetical protein [Candidatus Methylacidiphilales bacterium]